MSIAKRNFEEMMEIVNTIDFTRDPTKLLEYLVETDYFVAPASTNSHSNHEGGLYKHSMQVFKTMRHINKLLEEKEQFSDETMFFVAFIHDLCKVNTYKIVKKWRKDKNNKWEEYETYGIEEDFPCGHATKSIVLAMPLVELTKEEIVAIRYHMGSFQETDYMSGRLYNEARKFSKLTTLLQSSDILASDVFEEILER